MHPSISLAHSPSVPLQVHARRTHSKRNLMRTDSDLYLSLCNHAVSTTFEFLYVIRNNWPYIPKSNPIHDFRIHPLKPKQKIESQAETANRTPFTLCLERGNRAYGLLNFRSKLQEQRSPKTSVEKGPLLTKFLTRKPRAAKP